MTQKQIRALRAPFLRELFRGNRFAFALTIFATVIASAATLVMSWLLKEVIDLIAGVSPYTLGQLLLVTALGVVAPLLICAAIDGRFLSAFRAKAMKQYREYVFSRLMKKGIRAFSGENSSLYLSALSNDAATIERDFIFRLQSIVETGLTFIGALALMLWLSPLLTLVAIGFSILPVAVSVLFGNKAAEAEKQVSDRKETYTGLLKDVLTGFSVIKVFRAEESVGRIHGEHNDAVAGATAGRVRASVLVNYSSLIAGGAVQFGVFFVAAALALSGRDITGGTVLVFVQLMNFILSPIQSFPEFFAGAKASLALIDKLALALDQNVSEEGEAIPAELKKGISLRHVGFSYEEGVPVLKDVNMELRAGGCYALVGGSGSGKSTILNLLMAAWPDYEGGIFYDGKDLKDISPSSLYDLVSVIQQEVFVFNSTIRNNITMFSPFPEEEVERAVRLSGLARLVEEKGEDFLCGENGSALSGGERQRISIARALLSRTPVLFVDEATASLDAVTARGVFDAILDLEGYTRLIVTHDYDENVLRRCDAVFALKNGELEEEGTFGELMEKKGYFYSLYTVSK